jgi:hypothetical protein
MGPGMASLFASETFGFLTLEALVILMHQFHFQALFQKLGFLVAKVGHLFALSPHRDLADHGPRQNPENSQSPKDEYTFVATSDHLPNSRTRACKNSNGGL